MNTDFWRKLPLEEFDYGLLMSALSQWKNPRQKVTSLLRQGHILRVKKGLYVWGPDWRRRPIHPEILANLIYGPSIVSGEWALSFHGLIPEGVRTVTSTTPKPPREFQTPLGLFRYERVPWRYHSLGMMRIEADGTGFLMANPERALCDKLLGVSGLYRPSKDELWNFLLENLRMEEEAIRNFDLKLVLALAESARSPRLFKLADLLDQQGGEK